MRILVRSPCLPGYNDVAKTVLVTLTMAGHFQDRLMYVLGEVNKGVLPNHIDLFEL